MKYLLAVISSSFFFILSLQGVWADGNRVVICGTGDSQELLRHLASEFSSQHPEISVDVPDSIGSSGGVKSTARGNCDLGRMARPLKRKELKYKLSYKVFAYSPVVFFTHANVTEIQQLSAEQVTAIFSGTLTNWNDVGGSDGPIYVAHREKGDSSRRVLTQQIPSFATIEQQAGVTFYSTQEIVETVASHPNTIGYTSLSAVKNNAKVKPLAFEGVNPDVDEVTGSNYPLLSPFGLVWRADPAPATENFLHFLSTPTAQTIITNYGVILPTAQ